MTLAKRLQDSLARSGPAPDPIGRHPMAAERVGPMGVATPNSHQPPAARELALPPCECLYIALPPGAVPDLDPVMVYVPTPLPPAAWGNAILKGMVHHYSGPQPSCISHALVKVVPCANTEIA